MKVPIQIHHKFKPLLDQPHTIANIYGGRGGMKSTQVQLIALLKGIREPLRVCEARETMSSIKDSSHKLLSDLIYKHSMATSQNGPYEVQESRILRKESGRTETEFIFVGVRENVRDQKSLANISLTIFEEAAKASEDSLEVFMPTVLREENSKMWFIWNPEYVTDPTYKLLMVNTPSNTIHIQTNYLENPWLSDTMRTLAEDMRISNPAKFEHIWMGKPISDIEGAIYGEQIIDAEAEGRITQVPRDRMKPVDTFWDLGWGDMTAIWFAQAYDGWYHIVDYLEDSGKTIEDYMVKLQNKQYRYGTHFLPHDGIDTIIHKKLAGGDRRRSIEMIMRQAGWNVRITPKMHITDGIDAVRMIFPKCRFDRDKCQDGLHALKLYQWGAPNKAGGVAREPLHNAASHGADAFRGLAVSIREPEVEENEDRRPSRRQVGGPDAWLG